jgi:hypothetical protein
VIATNIGRAHRDRWRIGWLVAAAGSIGAKASPQAEADEMQPELYGLWVIPGVHISDEEEAVEVLVLDVYPADADALAPFDWVGDGAHRSAPVA